MKPPCRYIPNCSSCWCVQGVEPLDIDIITAGFVSWEVWTPELLWHYGNQVHLTLINFCAVWSPWFWDFSKAKGIKPAEKQLKKYIEHSKSVSVYSEYLGFLYAL